MDADFSAFFRQLTSSVPKCVKSEVNKKDDMKDDVTEW